MTGKLTRRQIQGIKKMLSYNYLEAKKLKKQIQIEKANRRKNKRHKSKQQEVEELIEQELEWEGDYDNDR